MHNALWQSILGEVELSVSPANFKTWFKNAEMVEQSGSEVIIEVHNAFAKSQFESKLNKYMVEALKSNGVEAKKITYRVKSGRTKQRVNRETTSGASVDDLLSMRDIPSTMQTKRAHAPSGNEANLNPRYTFANFIVGSSNDLAYSASRAVADNPGTKYNPLYLYGGVGLGKTHLMQAIGNEIVNRDSSKRVMYVSTETFVNEFLDHVRYKTKGFSDKYRNIDVLIIDDMQFIAGKEKTQEEFFHTFNHLHQNNKQIIISSDKPPRSIPTLTERLRSRFEMGMAIDIQMPDYETRSAIVTAKAEASGVMLGPETVEYLATNIKTNIRELEGALNQLLAYAEMRGINPDVSVAEGFLGNVRTSRPRHLNTKTIIDKTARHFSIKTDEIMSSSRSKHIVVPRQVAMYLLRSELHLSFPKIAIELGRKDHTTAIHSIEKIEKATKLDLKIREDVHTIREALYV